MSMMFPSHPNIEHSKFKIHNRIFDLMSHAEKKVPTLIKAHACLFILESLIKWNTFRRLKTLQQCQHYLRPLFRVYILFSIYWTYIFIVSWWKRIPSNSPTSVFYVSYYAVFWISWHRYDRIERLFIIKKRKKIYSKYY